MKRILSMILAALLLCGSIGCVVISHVTKYANADKYTAGGFTYEASAVKRVELEWAAGDVTLVNGNGTLSVSESGGDTLSQSERLHWWLDGTTLRIKYCESGFSHVIQAKKKHLTLELPTENRVDLKIDIASGAIGADSLYVQTLDVNTASGGMQIDRMLDAEEVKIDSASGGIHFGAVTVDTKFTVDTASGGLTVDRINAKTVKIESASGGVTLGLDTADTVNIDAASGKILLKLADPARGATVSLQKVSGTFDCKLPMTAEGKSYKIGGGEIRIDIDAVSGSITIE